jgi:EAL domain-containing protein (putative c-di-GMP-specific phosphodiesterase class I)
MAGSARVLRVQRGIRSIKKLGCWFAIDDFGTGFSSFAYLRALPVDDVKIDGSYVRDVDRDPTSRALVTAMVAVAHFRVSASPIRFEA